MCEAVLDLPGSAATLAELARSNMLLVPLDRQGEWYRYHHLFHDMLLAELHRQEPGLIPVLRRRAADWCQQKGLHEEALEYSIAAGDVGTAARLIGNMAVPTYRQGRVKTIQRWFRWLDAQGASETHPMAAVVASMFSALMGQTFEAERLADAVDRWQYQDGALPADPSAEAWAALSRAFLCRQGINQMRADADEAVRRFTAERFVTPGPALLQGVARVLSGDFDGGDASLLNALSVDVGAPEDFAIALSERSLVAIARSDWAQAADLAGQAEAVLRRAGIEEGMVTPLVCAVQARVAIHRRDTPAARQRLVTAQRTRPVLTYAVPQLAVQARIELARAHLALADIAGARTLMRETDEILRRRPHLGTLVGEAAELRALLAKQRGPSSPGASALTAAELRLLPLLSTHLTLPEISQELFVSHNTVKSHVRTIYRKLGADSRSQAVAQARAVGLLEG
jgi:LuxR family maltose regulon positive regulatory protein